MAIDQAGVGNGPDALDPLGHICHQHVGVHLGVARPRRAMREGGRDEPFGADAGQAARDPTDTEDAALEVAKGLVESVLVDPRTTAEVAGSESPKSGETDFGADQVMSKPATLLVSSTRPAVRISPLGEAPASTCGGRRGRQSPRARAAGPPRRARSPGAPEPSSRPFGGPAKSIVFSQGGSGP